MQDVLLPEAASHLGRMPALRSEKINKVERLSILYSCIVGRDFCRGIDILRQRKADSMFKCS